MSFVLAVVPALWMPLSFRRPSQFLFLLQYLVLYVPTLFVSYHSLNPAVSPERVLLISAVLFGGISIMQSALWLPVLRIPKPALPPCVFWAAFLALTTALMAYVAVNLWSVLQAGWIRGDVRRARGDGATGLRRRSTRWVRTALAGRSLPAVPICRRNVLSPVLDSRARGSRLPVPARHRRLEEPDVRHHILGGDPRLVAARGCPPRDMACRRSERVARHPCRAVECWTPT